MTLPKAQHRVEKNHILVIDDDIVSRSLLKEILAKEGYVVAEADNGRDGLDAVADFNPELIMLDVMMPGMNGFEVCQELRKIHGYNEVAVIMLTGLNDVTSVDEAFEVGANDFITKPINWPLLVKRVRYAIRDQKTQLQMKRNEARLLHAQRIAKLAYWHLHKATQRMEFSDNFYAQFHGSEFTLNNFNDYIEAIHPDDRTHVEGKFTEVYNQHRTIEFDHRLLIDGATYYFHINIEPELNPNGALLALNGTIQNITQQRNTEALLEYQKNHDELTGLPNKRSIKDYLNKAVANPAAEKELTAVLAIGLVRFKELNDAMGHHFGDVVLKTIAKRLYSASPESMIGRYETETFSVILKNFRTVIQIEQAIDGILQSLLQPYRVNGQEVYIDCRLGASIFPIEDISADMLLTNSIIALNNAMQNDSDKFCFHSPMMNKRATLQRDIETQLRKAMQDDKLQLFYQPQIALGSGRLIGAEALLRLQLTENKFMSPLDFIPVAEETGLIIPIGYWIFNNACRQIRSWLDSGIEHLRIGINLSAKQFNDRNLITSLSDAINRYRIPGQCIDLEITESIALDDLDKTIDILQSFKQSGYTISMDDFGTGYSSLSSIHLLPIDVLKVDRAFIKDIGPNGSNGTMARTIINMAHNLNLTVIAEGAEDEHQIEFLKANHCDEVQGFYYSKPLPADEFSAYCRKYNQTVHSISANPPKTGSK